RARVGGARLVAVLEPRSNTMRMGVHKDALANALSEADRVLLYRPPDLDWSLSEVSAALGGQAQTVDSIATIVDTLCSELVAGDHVLIMSNGGFGGLHGLLATALTARAG
ncbi:MAG TPA: UDP-N-acetylmuramate:L-alanyl-gamma-D-glutamyl-meso-diaminopimelate ligase, partial [Gammaproteobacteria bacterium]|nr:UDP-N-acetylmuramate:L-alanyl-gamma-D-glutamyl-meso-diaminopimelate ligase [Gammaproteobacteria bacterium]